MADLVFDLVGTAGSIEMQMDRIGPRGVGIADVELNADYTLTVTLTDGTSYTTESIRGEQGEQGVQGQPGTPGQPGEDGVSPTVTVTDITGGHRVTITDATGTDTFDVMDGSKGDPGTPGQPGADGADGHTPEKGVDYWTAEDQAEIVAGAAGTVEAELIDDTAGAGDTDKVWSADKLSSLNSALNGILVYKQTGEQVTLTNQENTDSFYNANSVGGVDKYSFVDGVLTYKSETSTEKSPYIYHTKNLGTKKWICGFKYRLTKLDPNLGEPECVRVHLGTTAYDASVVWDEWVYFCQTAELDLTRIRFSLRNFSVAPPADALKIEIKEMFLYDVSNVNNDLILIIQQEQQTNYQDGEVTYGETELGYFPDDSLSEEGKAADSKAVGNAISKVRFDVTEHGVKGDGITDDTDAIRAVFENNRGLFYFPAGTYKISGTITIPSGSEMYGDGDETIINLYNGNDLSEMVFRGTSKVYPYILVNSSDNTKLHDFKLIGNNTLQQKRHAGIGVLDSANCVISGLTIYNINYDPNQDNDATVSGYGICVTRSTFVNVERCNVQQCGYECIGIVDSCDHCVVRDCYTQDGWRTCIQVHRGSCNTTVENCYMKQNHTKYDSCFTVHGLPAQIVKNLTVNNCVFECLQNGAQAQTYCAPAQIMGDTDKLCFTNNKIFGGKRAFYINESHTNAKIIGNDMQCNSDSDYGVTISSYNTVVIGNVLSNEAATPVNVISNNPVIYGNIGIS